MKIWILFVALLVLSCQEPPEQADLNIFYSTGQKGEIRGCGCRVGGGGMHQKKASFDLNRELYPHSLLLDGGHFAHKWIEKNENQGKVMLDLYSRLKYDVVNVTPFDYQDGLENFMEWSSGPTNYVSANLLDKESNDLIFDPYVIKTVNCNGLKVKVGVIGLFESDYAVIEDINRKAGVIAVDADSALMKYGKELKEKADFVVVLGYTKWGPGTRRADKFSDLVDLYVNGSCDFQDYLDKDSVIVAQSHRESKNYGIISLTFNKKKELIGKKNQFVWVNKNDPVDEEIREYLVEKGYLHKHKSKSQDSASTAK